MIREGKKWTHCEDHVSFFAHNHGPPPGGGRGGFFFPDAEAAMASPHLGSRQAVIGVLQLSVLLLPLFVVGATRLELGRHVLQFHPHVVPFLNRDRQFPQQAFDLVAKGAFPAGLVAFDHVQAGFEGSHLTTRDTTQSVMPPTVT